MLPILPRHAFILKICAAVLALALCARANAGASTPPTSLEPTLRRVGGGYTDAGMRGEYFGNADLAGSPCF